MKIAIAQINTLIGDINHNRDIIIRYIEKSKEKDCDIVCFPELALTGYPPCDLLCNPEFIGQCEDAVENIAKLADGIDILLGAAISDSQSGKPMNCVVLLKDQSIHAIFPKKHLDRHVYFDETRYFIPGSMAPYTIDYGDMRLGILIGHIEGQEVLGSIYDEDGIDLFVNITATPYYYGRQTERIERLSKLANSANRPIVYVNMVGGNNELVFDGGSLVVNEQGHICAKAPSFEEDLLIWDIADNERRDFVKEDISYLYRGLVLGLRDYCNKLGSKEILLGLSGGVDSTLAACIATDAVGSDNVLAVSNHSRYTSKESRDDADKLVKNLGIRCRNMPIDNLFKAYINEFNEDGKPSYDLAEENVQARIRGDIWMFISNREGQLVISASNKSELHVGYTTMYGDMCGGMAPLSDIYKSQVYELCNFINREREIIPESIITKPPSAELKPDQKDEDSLPPYSMLDKVLYMYLEENLFEEDIISKGYDRDIVYRIIDMVQKSEYKRRQAAPPIRISKGWFKKARCMPIVHGFRPV